MIANSVIFSIEHFYWFSLILENLVHSNISLLKVNAVWNIGHIRLVLSNLINNLMSCYSTAQKLI